MSTPRITIKDYSRFYMQSAFSFLHLFAHRFIEFGSDYHNPNTYASQGFKFVVSNMGPSSPLKWHVKSNI